MKALRFNGVKAPKGVQTEDELIRLQNTVGVPATGVWDFLSEAAYEKYLKGFGVPLTTAYQVEGYSAPGTVRNQRDVKIMQEVLGNVTVDGIWGPETDSAYKARIEAEQGMDIAYPKPATTAKPIQSAPAANTMPAAFISAPATAGIAGKTTLGLPVQGGDASGSSGAPGWEKATVPGTDLQFGSMIEVEVYYGKRLQELWEAYTAAAAAATNRKTRTKQDQDALSLAQKNYTDMQKEYQDALAAVRERENRYYSDRFNYYYENKETKETDETTPFFYNRFDVDEYYEPLLDEAWDAYITAGNAAGRRGPGQRDAAAAADKAYEEYLYLKSLRDQAYQAAQTYEEINGFSLGPSITNENNGGPAKDESADSEAPSTDTDANGREPTGRPKPRGDRNDTSDEEREMYDRIDAYYEGLEEPIREALSSLYMEQKNRTNNYRRGEINEQIMALENLIFRIEQERQSYIESLKDAENEAYMSSSPYYGLSAEELDAYIADANNEYSDYAKETGRKYGAQNRAEAARSMLELVPEIAELTEYRDMLVTLEETERLEAFDYRGAAAEVASGSGIDLSDVPLTEDHESKKDKILARQNEYLELLDDSAEVPPYDPLKPLADEILEEIENGQYSKDELELLIEQYNKLPILLTDETLNNPYALLYADLLSIRMVNTESQRIRIEMAIEQLRKEMYHVQNPEQLIYIQIVGEMLGMKLETSAAFMAVVDTLLLNIPSKFPLEKTFGEDGSAFQQYLYFTSFDAARQANPGTYDSMGKLTTAVGYAVDGYAVLGAKVFSQALKLVLLKRTRDDGLTYMAELLSDLLYEE